MIHAQNDRVVAELPTGTTASSGTATMTIDTRGWNYASVNAVRASNASTTFASILKVEESDDNSSYSNVDKFVLGGTGGFTLPAISTAGTAASAVVKMDIDCKALKRYLKVSYTPNTTVNVALSARLSRGEESPVSVSEANVLGWVRG